MFVVPRNTTSNPVSPNNTATSRQTRSTDASRGRGAAFSAAANTAGIATNSSAAANSSSAARSEPAAGLGVQKLLDTLKALGMNVAGLDIRYSEDVVGYPGGSYVNRMIDVTIGGKTERLSADLTDRNPLIAAYDIHRYLGVMPSNGGTGGA